ncbi:MAG: hypothetical protein R2854_09155 [Caldilineaceae bacterium]
MARYDGTLIDLNIGDKGSYATSNFGAPLAHEDGAARAAGAALDLQRMPAQLAHSAGADRPEPGTDARRRVRRPRPAHVRRARQARSTWPRV